MRLLRPAAFAALVLATVGAFFVTQHLKVTTPLINGYPRPSPSAFNPVDGRICRGGPPDHKVIDYRRVKISFYLQHRADTVAVYVVNDSGQIVATVASGRYMAIDNRNPDGDFRWNGREGNQNGPFAPAGTYYFRVALLHEGRTFTLTDVPFQIITTPPHPDVTSVVATGGGVLSTGPAIITPPQNSATIHFKPGDYRSARIELYRTDLPGKPLVVKSFGVNGRLGVAVWNGLIGGRPAPAGTYLVGISVTDTGVQSRPVPDRDAAAARNHPAYGRDGALPGRTAAAHADGRGLGHDGAGLLVRRSIRVVAATRRHAADRLSTGITPAASEVAQPQPVQGHVPHAQASLPLRFVMPAQGAGLYELALRSGARRRPSR